VVAVEYGMEVKSRTKMESSAKMERSAQMEMMLVGLKR
jgi:hypothetical protein